MIGRTYYERGDPVVVLAAWKGPDLGAAEHTLRPKDEYMVVLSPSHMSIHADLTLVLDLRPTAPHNVLIQRGDGSLVVRPFRGLRKQKPKVEP